jgi:hypothetical protein
MQLTVSSVDCKPSNHRTIKGAHHACCQRLNIGDKEITVTCVLRGRVLTVPFTEKTTQADIALSINDQYDANADYLRSRRGSTNPIIEIPVPPTTATEFAFRDAEPAARIRCTGSRAGYVGR